MIRIKRQSIVNRFAIMDASIKTIRLLLLMGIMSFIVFPSTAVGESDTIFLEDFEEDLSAWTVAGTPMPEIVPDTGPGGAVTQVFTTNDDLNWGGMALSEQEFEYFGNDLSVQADVRILDTGIQDASIALNKSNALEPADPPEIGYEQFVQVVLRQNNEIRWSVSYDSPEGLKQEKGVVSVPSIVGWRHLKFRIRSSDARVEFYVDGSLKDISQHPVTAQYDGEAAVWIGNRAAHYDNVEVLLEAQQQYELGLNVSATKQTFSIVDYGEHVEWFVRIENHGFEAIDGALLRLTYSGDVFVDDQIDWVCENAGACNGETTNRTGEYVTTDIWVNLESEGSLMIMGGAVLKTLSPDVASIELSGILSENVIIPDADDISASATIVRGLPDNPPISQSTYIFWEDAIDPSVDTVVLTHGLHNANCEVDDLWTGRDLDEAGGILRQEIGQLNILRFHWTGACQVNGLPDDTEYNEGFRYTRDAGESLAEALFNHLGAGYSGNVHFVGHSLGTVVNAYGAKRFLERVSGVTRTQFTILDFPHRVEKLLSKSDWGSTAISVPRSFFQEVLPVDEEPSRYFAIDNYYATGGLLDRVSTGVGVAIDDPGNRVCNRELTHPHEVGSTYLPNETNLAIVSDAKSNDHSGVHQWYRWTMIKKDGPGFTGADVCYGETWDGEAPVHDSLLPCMDGWNESMLKDAIRPLEMECQNRGD